MACLCVSSGGLAAAQETSPYHFHGYGEMHFNRPKIGTMSQGAGDEIDFHRMVFGFGYDFSEKIRLDFELDFEHAFTEPELEYAQVDFDLLPGLTLRGGNLLIPVGPLNEFHEPPLFYSVERPYVQRSIIPTTWQENGAGVVGRVLDNRLAYRAYAVSGLDGAKITSLDGLHDVSSKGAEAKANDFAGTGRVEFTPIRELTVAASGYFGGADQDEPGLGKVEVDIAEGDFHFQIQDIDLTGVFVRTKITGARQLSLAAGETIGKAMQGWYGEAAVHTLKRLLPETSHDLVLFGRFEKFDTNHEVPAGFVQNLKADREIFTFGLAYYPIDRVTVKSDLELWKDGTDDTVSRFNLGLAFMY